MALPGRRGCHCRQASKALNRGVLLKCALMRLQVIWRLDSGARTFLPRLQGALTAITPAPSDAACYVVTQADNTIRMVGAHLYHS
jgi:hypothetical protein